MAGSYIMTPKLAAETLQSILDIRRDVREKTQMQLDALNIGANALEKAAETDPGLTQKAHIMRYHAGNKGAYMFQDDFTRGALKAAVSCIKKDAARYGGGEYE